MTGETNTQKSEGTPELLKESTLAEKDNDDRKFSENGTVAKAGDAPKGAKLVASESKVVSNGVANGC